MKIQLVSDQWWTENAFIRNFGEIYCFAKHYRNQHYQERGSKSEKVWNFRLLYIVFYPSHQENFLSNAHFYAFR